MIMRQGEDWALDSRRAGRTEHIELNGEQDLRHDDMVALLQGMQQSMPFLPAVWN